MINLNSSKSFLLAVGFIFFTTKSFAQDAKKQLKVLSSVVVTASNEQEAADGYKTNLSSSSSRIEAPLLNTPQAISVVTQEQIRDQNIVNMEQAARYVAGVNVQQGESNRDQVTIRGNNTSADFFIDGARDDTQYFRDFYNIESVEFLKGPNAMAFGRGGSGGVINRVLKYADGTKKRRLVLSGGSFENRRGQVDLGDRVNEKFSLRLNSMYEKSGTFRQNGNLERYGFAPTATLEIGDNTELRFGYEHFSDARFNDRGIPSQNGSAFKTNPKTFFGNPDENNSSAKIDSIYNTLIHNFDEKTQLKNLTRYTRSSKFYQNVYTSSAVNSVGNFDIAAYNNYAERNSITNQTNLSKKFTLGATKHHALIGGEITSQNTKSVRNTGYFNNVSTSETLSINNLLSYTPITFRPSATDANNNVATNVYAVFAQDQIDFNKNIQLTSGLRYDSFTTSLDNYRNSQNFKRSDDLISPRLGLVLKPQENLSFYSNYSVTYLPSSGDQFSSLDQASALLKPEKMTNYELGAKFDVTPKFNLTSAIYQLNRKNTRANDPNNVGFFIATGESRTRGFEFSANGKITENWNLIAAYSFQDAKIISNTSTATKGKRVALVPQNTASIWNKYDFTPKFAAGLGIVSQSSQFAAVDNSVKLKGFTRFDAAIYYKINPSYRIQLNVENLFNRGYIQTAHNNNNISPGSTRAFKFSLLADF
jgi:catecholate siderophore receptor